MAAAWVAAFAVAADAAADSAIALAAAWVAALAVAAVAAADSAVALAEAFKHASFGPCVLQLSLVGVRQANLRHGGELLL